MPVEEPSTASRAEVAHTMRDVHFVLAQASVAVVGINTGVCSDFTLSPMF